MIPPVLTRTNRGRRRAALGPQALYSRADGRRGREGRCSCADAKDRMMEQLETMMEDASNEKEREAVRRCMSQLENT